jgi:hypothetical protein
MDGLKSQENALAKRDGRILDLIDAADKATQERNRIASASEDIGAQSREACAARDAALKRVGGILADRDMQKLLADERLALLEKAEKRIKSLKSSTLRIVGPAKRQGTIYKVPSGFPVVDVPVGPKKAKKFKRGTKRG